MAEVIYNITLIVVIIQTLVYNNNSTIIAFFVLLVGELCELFCIAESHSIQITPPIDDGTPCVVEDGTKGRCIGKLCAVSISDHPCYTYVLNHNQEDDFLCVH